MMEGRLVNFGKPDEHGRAHFAGKIDIEALMAEDTEGGQIVHAEILAVLIDKMDVLIFARTEPAALAGMIVAARLNSATPNAGEGFELDVIAACFIGGASASGGIGTVIGAVVGAFFIGVMNNGMSLLGVGIDWQQAIKGFVLLLAVFFDVYNKNKGSGV